MIAERCCLLLLKPTGRLIEDIPGGFACIFRIEEEKGEALQLSTTTGVVASFWFKVDHTMLGAANWENSSELLMDTASVISNLERNRLTLAESFGSRSVGSRLRTLFTSRDTPRYIFSNQHSTCEILIIVQSIRGTQNHTITIPGGKRLLGYSSSRSASWAVMEESGLTVHFDDDRRIPYGSTGMIFFGNIE